MSAPRLGLPALGNAYPRPLCPSDISPASGGNPRFERGEGMRAGSLCDAGLMRRAPGTFPPTLRHGPPDLAPDFRIR